LRELVDVFFRVEVGFNHILFLFCWVSHGSLGAY
jgi:hypothetical protein